MNALVRHLDTLRLSLAAERARVRSRIRFEEADFLPAGLEVVERPVSPASRLTVWLLLLGLSLAMLWLVLGRVDVVASATGKLIPADHVKLVQPAEPGVVRAILVADNQRVRAGQVVVELDPTMTAADAREAREALATSQLDAARTRAILAALDGRRFAFVPPAGTSPAVADIQRALTETELADVRKTAAVQGANAAAAAAAAAKARGEREKLVETLPLIDAQLDAYEGLLSKGFVPRVRVIEMRRQRLAAARDADIAADAARQAEAQSRSTANTEAQSAAEIRVQLLQRLAKAEGEIAIHRAEVVKADQKRRYQRLRSPIDGIVTQLAVHTIGGVVEAAKPIMAIVPEGGPLMGEVQIRNRDIGFVHKGQPVAVKLAAFPFVRYGAVSGRVSAVSSDSIDTEKAGLVYTARIALDRDAVPTGDTALPLGPGMEITADIRTGSRSILGYLLSPMEETVREAARER